MSHPAISEECCDRCGEVGEDRRTLSLACFYDLTELGIPFKEKTCLIPVSVAKSEILDVGLSNSTLVAKVNKEDFPSLSVFKWRVAKRGKKIYCTRDKMINGKNTKVYMHRQLMGLPYGDRRQVDHKDGDGLNNTRENLRVCTASQNMKNGSVHTDSVSGLKGVSWNKQKGKWAVYISSGSLRKCVGLFEDKFEAALAYDNSAKEIHGEFARLNYPGMFPRVFFNLRICKNCRAEWMTSIKKWFESSKKETRGCGSGIFIRRNGALLEITEEEWDRMHPGHEPCRVKPDKSEGLDE